MSWFEDLIGYDKNNPKRYDKEKVMAVSGTPKQRLSLAKRTRTNQEILFYLAQHDTDPKVRKAVAKNTSTPLHASGALAVDENEDVRLLLAGKLVKILPDISVDQQSQLYAYAVQALGTLALDEILKIRKSLASTLKDHAYAPPDVAAALARDLEREVSEPILRFCAALRDEDLVDILATHPAPWAAEAVASRRTLSALVSRAVIATGNEKAGALLLKNKGAEIDEGLLHDIIERAREFPEWHEPLATQHSLPPKMARQLSRYVDTRVRKLLTKNGHYDLQTTEIVTDATRRRIDLLDEMDGPKNKKSSKTRAKEKGSVVARVNIFLAEGKLTEETISDHLALKDHEFVIAALACLVSTKRANIDKVFSIRKPQMICSICWRAGLSMRLALRLQQEVAHVQAKDLIYPKGGTDYPLDVKDMQWQLDFLGIETT